jgi:hypothetical protein
MGTIESIASRRAGSPEGWSMMPTTRASADPGATLEIGGRHLPMRMVAGRMRADLPRSLARPDVLPHRRARLVAMTLLVLVAPIASITRHRRAA